MDNRNIIDTFNNNVEFGKYVFFAAYHVREHKDEIQKSIDGEYEEVRKKYGTRPLRGSEHYDINWESLTTVQEVYDSLIWSTVRYRMINLKVCCDDYAKDMGISNLAMFYKTVESTLPSLKFVLPDGSEVSPFDLLKNMRDTFAHNSDPGCKDSSCVPKDTDLRSLALTPIFFFDDGLDLKVASYDPHSEVIAECCSMHSDTLDYEQGLLQLFEILEMEVCRAINAFHAIRTGMHPDEEACIVSNFWRPLNFD